MILVSAEKEEVSCCGFTTVSQNSGLYVVRSRGLIQILTYKGYGKHG